MYSPEVETKETNETTCSAYVFDPHLEFDNSGHPSTYIYDKREDWF